MRVSMHLPDEMVSDLDALASKLGTTRSALLVLVSQAAIKTMRSYADQIPDNPSWDDVRRLRGESISILRQRICELEGEGEADEQSIL